MSGVNTGHANTDGANTGRANTDGANTGRANTGRANTGRANTDGAKAGRADAGRANRGGVDLDLDRASAGGGHSDGGASGLELRELRTLEELEDVYRLFDDIWHPEPGAAPVTVELMRALAHTGNYLGGAYRDGRLVGASVGFLAEPPGRALHSHVTGALAGAGIGFALKLHQREWALARGLDTITWTYDPLVRRNAHFNLAKLGALPREYLPSFYGPMDDAINAGHDSDRVLAEWPLNAPRVVAAVRRTPYRVHVPEDAGVALRDDEGRPVVCGSGAATVLVAVPDDVEALRAKDPAAARAWRFAVREVLGGLLAEGGRVMGFHDRRCYVVRRG